MKIAGLQNLSLVDYPGKVAAAVFVKGCNFRCGYCHNPDLLNEECPYATTEEEVLEYLTLRKNVLDGVVVSGGEPTLYKDLPEFIAKVRETGLSVKLDTNGTNPSMLDALMRAYLLDYVAIDVKTSSSKYDQLTKQAGASKLVSTSINLTLLSTCDYEFRTTCVRGLVEEEDIKEIAQLVKGAKKYFLQQFRPQNTFDKEFLKIKPYTKEELENFASILRETVEHVEVRGV